MFAIVLANTAEINNYVFTIKSKKWSTFEKHFIKPTVLIVSYTSERL